MLKVKCLDIDTGAYISQYSDLMRFVSDERKERISRFMVPVPKLLSLFAELLIRSEVSEAIGIPVSDISFGYGEYGKPYIKGHDLSFSVSHSGSRIIYVQHSAPVGADVEMMEEYLPDIGKRCFTENEQRFIDESEDMREAFYKIWTAKESYVKMTGDGFSRSMRSFDVCSMKDNIRTCIYDGSAISVCTRDKADDILIERVVQSELISRYRLLP